MTVGGLVVAVAALVALAVGAAVGVRSVDHLAGPAQEVSHRLDNAYYACLETQARSLARPGQRVTAAPQSLYQLVILEKVVGGWADLTTKGPPGAPAMTVARRPGPGSCLGDRIVAQYRDARGRVSSRVGTGASVPGNGPPPAPPT